MQGRFKIHIIDAAEKMNEMGEAAYLKTLEEPPPYAVIILIAETEDVVSETIRSRCRHLALGPVPTREIHAALIERGIDDERATTIAQAARGRAAWALTVAEKPDELLKRRQQVEDAFEKIATPLGRIEISGVIARDYSKKRDATLTMVETWLGLWRDALLLRTGLNDAIAYPEIADRLAPLARDVEIADLYRAVWATQRCMTDLGANVQARIAMHAMVMQWPSIGAAR
jgi:DNA polymerase-3 subunit delta'